MTKSLSHAFDWRILHSRYPVRDRWLSLRADTCQSPSGHLIDPYYIFEYPDFVNVVALTPRDEVVLVREYRHGAGLTLLEIPGGAMDADDTSPEEAARRELLEETGFGGGNFNQLCVLSADSAHFANRTHSFLARGVERTDLPHLDAAEQIEVVLTPLNQVVAMLYANQFLQSMHTAALFYALHQLAEHRSLSA